MEAVMEAVAERESARESSMRKPRSESAVRKTRPAEMTTAVGSLPTANGTARNNAMQDLAWSLFNKVDFVFNY